MARKNKTVKMGAYPIFTDFSHGLYLIDTPRNIGEQLASLAMTGGRNCWSEKGALVPQYGYLVKSSIAKEDRIVGVSKTSASSTDFFLLSINGSVYFYTAYQGLKKYATSLDLVEDSPQIIRKGREAIIFTGGAINLFGGYYPEATEVPIQKNVVLRNFSSYYQFECTATEAEYYWIGKEVGIGTDKFTIRAVREELDGSYTVEMVIDGEQKAYPDPVTIGERAVYPLSLTYTPEQGDPIAISPKLLSVCGNRLYVVDVTGRIFYSQIGLIDNFNQSAGAGYFVDFFNDSSQVLSIEDFLHKALICTENGIYIASIGNEVKVEKISQVGQKYAGDHVVVGEKVYAFDSNSGAIVNAVSVNVFGAYVSGKPIVPSEYLDAENYGINSSKRTLTYNAESGVLILYYGERSNKGIVMTMEGNLFPRELDKGIDFLIGFNQGVAFVTDDNEVCQDFKKGSIIPNIKPVVEFEQIALRDNKLTLAGVLEITELNGIDYTLNTTNDAFTSQKIKPSFNSGSNGELLPPLIYSDKNVQNNSYAELSRWADKSSNLTRVFSSMSGRNGISIGFEFPENVAFCVSALGLPDFSQGE